MLLAVYAVLVPSTPAEDFHHPYWTPPKGPLTLDMRTLEPVQREPPRPAMPVSEFDIDYSKENIDNDFNAAFNLTAFEAGTYTNHGAVHRSRGSAGREHDHLHGGGRRSGRDHGRRRVFGWQRRHR